MRRFYALLFTYLLLTGLLLTNRQTIASDNASTFLESQPVQAEATATQIQPSRGSGDLMLLATWTTDDNEEEQYTFNGGDLVRYYAAVYNFEGGDQSADFAWTVTGPCNFGLFWEGSINIPDNISHLYLRAYLPPNACAGEYTLQVTMNDNAIITTESSTFTVEPLATATPTATPTNPASTNLYACGTPLGSSTVAAHLHLEESYQTWRATYVTAVGANGFLRVQAPEFGGDTVSEGIGYGMLLAAYMQDKDTFDGLWRYALYHQNDNGLMSWYISADGYPVQYGSATDADMLMAFALIVAEESWGEYWIDAYFLLHSIEYNDIEADTNVIKPGDQWGDTEVTNPSYFPPAFLKQFALFSDNPRWNDITDANYLVIANLNATTASGTTGLLPDWTTVSGDPIAGYSFDYGYNATRTALRLSTDAAWYCDSRAMSQLSKLNAFFEDIGADSIRDGYRLDGSQFGQHHNAAFVAPVAAAAIHSVDSLHRAAIWSETVDGLANGGVEINENYYNESLRVLSLLLATGNMPMPLIDTTTPTSTPTPPPTNTPSPTATSTPYPVPTNTPTATNTPLPTATNTPTATHTPLPTSTNTPSPTATNTPPPTATSTPLPTATNTPLPTSTPTSQPTPAPTATPPLPTDRPNLIIPSTIKTQQNVTVTVPISYTANGQSVSSLIFAVEFDDSCLSFDGTDADENGIPDAVQFNLPATFGGSAIYDAEQASNLIKFFVGDTSPPLATLSSREIATIQFVPVCPAVEMAVETEVIFAASPPPSFGGTNGQNIIGAVRNGSVLIEPNTQTGDCNGDDLVNSADISADVLEVFDGDGNSSRDVTGGTFIGNPQGCDANGNNIIEAGDISCTLLLIFFGGESCGAVAGRSGVYTTVSLSAGTVSADANSQIDVPISFSRQGNVVSSATFSIDYDETLLSLDTTDADQDGIPDSIVVDLPSGFDFSIVVDSADNDGEIDVFITDMFYPFATLPDGDWLTLTFTTAEEVSSQSSAHIRFSKDPTASFGSADGQHVDSTVQDGLVQIGSVPTVVKLHSSQSIRQLTPVLLSLFVMLASISCLILFVRGKVK